MRERKDVTKHHRYSALKYQWDNSPKLREEFFEFDTFFYWQLSEDLVGTRYGCLVPVEIGGW